MASTPRTPAPERPPPPVPAPPPPLEPPSPSSQAGDEYHTPAPSLGDASPREDAGFTSDGRGGGPPAKSPPLTPMRFHTSHLLLPPTSPSGQNGKEEGATAAAAAAVAAATPARRPLRLTGLDRTPSQGSLATKSPSSLPSPTPPSPLTPAPVVNGSNKSGQSTPKQQRAETWKPPLSPAFNAADETITSPLRLGKARLDHHQHQQHQHQQHQHQQQGAENGDEVPRDVAAVAAVGERRALSVTLRVGTAVLSLAAFSVIASARTSGWAGDNYARHQQYRYAVAVNVIVCAYSIAQSFGEIRRLIAPRTELSTTCCCLQVLAYLLMSASSAAASRNDLWVSRFGTDAFNRKISSALWLSFIGFLMLALNALISTANLFSML
ncbi:CASP-like protein 4U1 [Dichanthelium oligosanthes]|uniref:CASP-like protein n=1 Tax=Dichanthelium oligosanthes TaxID=888268 RepID=A0A1E5UUM6_9POAL|nr:CASP-like protein 4U1 [Dichanthelium oligosanthes]